MNKEKQRIAIAEACGWTRKKGMRAWNRPNNNGWDCLEQLPDYTNDLNAMHEAEKVLTPAQLRHYTNNHLYTVVIEEDADRSCADNFAQTTCATSAQRAEAFLRTIEKWE